jgi:hypothetical protein
MFGSFNRDHAARDIPSKLVLPVSMELVVKALQKRYDLVSDSAAIRSKTFTLK